jgi:hypothetical protein
VAVEPVGWPVYHLCLAPTQLQHRGEDGAYIDKYVVRLESGLVSHFIGPGSHAVSANQKFRYGLIHKTRRLSVQAGGRYGASSIASRLSTSIPSSPTLESAHQDVFKPVFGRSPFPCRV